MKTGVEDRWNRALAAQTPPALTPVIMLLLDDDAVDAGLVARLVSRSCEFDVVLTTCRTAEQAAELLSGADFDVALIDYWLGADTSIGFIEEQSRLRATPWVLLTGLDMPDIRRCASRAGAFGFLAKDDLSTQAIEGVIRAALAHRNLMS